MAPSPASNAGESGASSRVPFAFGPFEGEVIGEAELRIETRLAGAPLPSVMLGLMLGGVDLGASTIVRARSELVRESWCAASGKSSGRLDYAHLALTVEMRHDTGPDWQLEIRVSEDGFAVRYAASGLWGVSRVDADRTRLRLPPGGRTWVLDYQTWYETVRRGVDVAELADGDYGFPFLIRLAADTDAPYLLITESGIDGRFCGAHAGVDHDRTLRFALADDGVEVARGPLTPWRVFLAGGLPQIVASRFVDELAPDPSIPPAVAVRPGRAAWSWWSDFYSGAQLERQRHFVDRAAQFGWEHLLIDCGWEETWIPEIVAYASRRGIQVHLWTVWHDLDGPEKLGRLALWRSWGIAGIKVDFMESEAKDRYRWYDAVLAETARLGLAVNFHGSVIPRGWVRTWPQVVGFEAVRGSEYYVFYQDTPLEAAHNVILPFTRNVVGPMDYTPVALTAPGRTTSDGHELGLAIVFECGITHFADDVDVYAGRPEVARALSELPARWDETVLLAGTPDTEAVIARRSGDRWFVGAIAVGPARALTVPLAALGSGPWRAWTVTDDPAGGLRDDESGLDGALHVELVEDGGFFAILAPADTALFRATPRPESPAPLVEPARGSLDASGTAAMTTSPSATVLAPPGWTATSAGGGRWCLLAPAGLAPGALGVVTVVEPGADGVPVIAHSRLVAPLTAGSHVLSRLPMLSFRNESGPVERDQSNGGGNPGDGAPMRVGDVSFDDGLGVSTPSEIVLALDGRAHELHVAVGVDAETVEARAFAEVLADDRVIAGVEVHGGRPPAQLDLDVTGARTLLLRTRSLAPGDPPAHVDWAGGRLTVHPD